MREAVKAKGPRARRPAEAGQSLIVAVIVLFLLLVLGAAFIALVANNLRNSRQSARGLAADAYAEAGVRFMDGQLTDSPDGADWRPTPECFPGATAGVCYDAQGAPKTTDRNDPDWQWIQPYHFDAATNQYVGGYARVTFGGDTPGSPGGRALVRVTYQPYATVSTGAGTVKHYNPGDPSCVDPTAAGCKDDSANAEVRKYIKLESVGRVGVINTGDPTTYNNTQALALRRELVAYKQIGITDYLRFFTNKDNKPSQATLGSSVQELDLDSTQTGGTFSSPPGLAAVDIPSYYVGGGIRSNAPLTFYGLNKMLFDPNLGESVEVAGPISLNGVDPNVSSTANLPPDNATTFNGQTNPARVSIVDLSKGATDPVLPSTSSIFATYGGLVRDNPAGSNTQGLSDVSNSANLRSVPRAAAPVLDAAGTNGVTRYRELTRESAPLGTADTGLAAALNARAGSYGWGQGLYLDNGGDVQRSSSLVNLYSLRTDWLNPGAGQEAGYWKGDFEYVPPGITITLTPRYIILTRSGEQVNQVNSYVDRFRFRAPDGTTLATQRVIRYTYDGGGGTSGKMNQAPTAGLPPDPSTGAPSIKFPGYPATKDANNVYNSDFVIYAEGNVRIRGVAGGIDPETREFFVRHLTVVSGGTIYVDGNLLRDNVPAGATGTAAQVKGRSSIALLAHDYVALNTSQFLAPENGKQFKQDSQQNYTYSAQLTASDPNFELGMSFAGIDSLNTLPPYLNDVSLYFRHAADGQDQTAINLFVNDTQAGGGPPAPNDLSFSLTDYTTGNFAAPAPDPRQDLTLSGVAPPPGTTTTVATYYNDDAFALTQTVSAATNNAQYLYGLGATANAYGANPPILGLQNRFTIHYDASSNPAPKADYDVNRFGVAPLDVRVEAILYAQEGSFFIIPGPWFNPDPRDTYAAFTNTTSQYYQKRPGDSDDPNGNKRVNPRFPFYRQPQDIRIALYGAITENMPAEVGDQGAWLEKWGWIPKYEGSRGLPTAKSYTANGDAFPNYHGPLGPLARHTFYIYNDNQGVTVGGAGDPATIPVGGIVYEYDARASSPYLKDANSNQVLPIRFDPNDAALPAVQRRPLPLTPRLPVAPGLLYVGEQPVQP